MNLIQEKRRRYVNQKFSEKVSGKSVSNKQKIKLFKSLWKEAKRKYR